MDRTVLEFCTTLESMLDGDWRRSLVGRLAREQPFARALASLHAGMRGHRWHASEPADDLRGLVDHLDDATRQEGCHVLHDWDGKAGCVTTNTIAGDVVDFLASQRGDAETQTAGLAIALDYHFAYLLALAAMRAWDTDDAGATLDRVTRLLALLQGPWGSGQRFADNAETLLLIATSHYEPNEAGYDLLLTRARALPPANRATMALTHAQAMGGHLRFGYEVTYGKDLKAMRDDNGADYPWVNFGLAGLMDEYDRLAAEGATGEWRDRVVEGLINALSPDPDAVLGRPVAWLEPHRAEHDRFLALFGRHRAELVPAFESHRPRDPGYWPLALFFNFSQNVLKGTVADALLRGEPWPLSLNDLFTGVPRDEALASTKATLARRLMAYSRRYPDTIRGRPSPVIVYDPVVGRQHFGAAMRAAKR